MAMEEFRMLAYSFNDALVARKVIEAMLLELKAVTETARAPRDGFAHGTYTCPYCYRAVPHSDETHDADRDLFEKAIHVESAPLCDEAKEWARGRLDKLQHAPRRSQGKSE